MSALTCGEIRSCMNLKDRLKGELPDELAGKLSNRLNLIGDIAIIQIPPELEPFKDAIGRAVLSSGMGIRTVLCKRSKVDGERRIAQLDHLCGRAGTLTVHREFGFSYLLDLSKVFFNSRLGYERMRVAEQVVPGEQVLLPFAGAGPFVVPLAAKGAHVLAVEKSREACLYLAENIRRNCVQENVAVINGDAFRMSQFIRRDFDRAVLPAPYGADGIIEAILPLVKPSGRLHLYAFKRMHEIESLERKYEDLGLDVLLCRRCGNVAPAVSRWVFDLAKR